jgi:hypothetical protein
VADAIQKLAVHGGVHYKMRKIATGPPKPKRAAHHLRDPFLFQCSSRNPLGLAAESNFV